MSPTPPRLLIAGLPGPMAAEVAALAVERLGPQALLPFALTRNDSPALWQGPQGLELRRIPPSGRDSLEIPQGTIAIDFTTPDAAPDNLRWYLARRIPFVMGTTGFDIPEARALVAEASVPAVIAANMAAPVVLLQALLQEAARRFPAALNGYSFQLEESHQATKRDVSGTARALVPALAALGLPATEKGITSHRDPAYQQEALGVPRESVAGHAWHFYRAQSPDGSTRLELSHCINGRRVYADGAVTAALFLHQKIAAGAPAQAYSMVDVLEG